MILDLNKNYIGFTLVEVLLVVAIFGILLASSVSILNTRIFADDLAAKALEVSNIIERAHNYSVAGYHDDVWGIKVLDNSSDCPTTGDCIILYKGHIYSSRDTAYDRFVDLETNTGVYINASQSNDFFFKPISGWLATSTGALAAQAIVLSSNAGGQKIVTTTETGLVYFGD